MKTVRHLAIVLGVGIAASGVYLSAQQPPPEREIGKLYGELCANCHGPKLEGAQFGSLVDDTWQFGSADADLARMIQKGNPGGMPPFEAVLSPQEVRAMVIYIREVGARAKREKTTYNKPAANAGPSFRVIIAAGKFQGVIAAQTPIGCLMTTRRRSSQGEGIVSP